MWGAWRGPHLDPCPKPPPLFAANREWGEYLGRTKHLVVVVRGNRSCLGELQWQWSGVQGREREGCCEAQRERERRRQGEPQRGASQCGEDKTDGVRLGARKPSRRSKPNPVPESGDPGGASWGPLFLVAPVQPGWPGSAGFGSASRGSPCALRAPPVQSSPAQPSPARQSPQQGGKPKPGSGRVGSGLAAIGGPPGSLRGPPRPPGPLTILSEAPGRAAVPLSPTSEGSVCDIQLVTMAMVLSTAPILSSGTDIAAPRRRLPSPPTPTPTPRGWGARLAPGCGAAGAAPLGSARLRSARRGSAWKAPRAPRAAPLPRGGTSSRDVTPGPPLGGGLPSPFPRRGPPSFPPPQRHPPKGFPGRPLLCHQLFPPILLCTPDWSLGILSHPLNALPQNAPPAWPGCSRLCYTACTPKGASRISPPPRYTIHELYPQLHSLHTRNVPRNPSAPPIVLPGPPCTAKDVPASAAACTPKGASTIPPYHP